MTETIVNRIGFLLQPAQRVAGVAITLAGIGVFFYYGISGLLILLVGLSMVFLKEFIHLDPANHKIKRSISFFPWLPIGKWHGIENYPYVSVVRKTISSNLTNHAGHQEVSTSRNVYYDIMILSTSHRSKILVKRMTDKEAAMESAKEIGQRLAREVVSYKPKVSEATRRRVKARR